MKNFDLSEVIRDALRFWESNEELIQYMKLEALKNRLDIESKLEQLADNPELGMQK